MDIEVKRRVSSTTVPPKTELWKPDLLSDLSKGIVVGKGVHDKALMLMVWFLILANSVLLIAIFGILVCEHIQGKSLADRVITPAVIGGLITGITVQTGGIVLAAFKGLFRNV